MPKARSWWRMRRIKHRDAVALCTLSASLLLAGEFANPVLLDIYHNFLEPVLGQPAVLAFRAVLAIFAFTTSFGVVLVLLGGWYFLLGRIGRGRMLVGLGVGLTSLSLFSRLAYAILVYSTPLPLLLPLATTFTGLGILCGVMAHTLMGQYALLLKKQAQTAWRRWRRSRRPSRG